MDSPDPSIPFVQAGDPLHPYPGTHEVGAVAKMLESNGVALLRGPEGAQGHTRELVSRDDREHTIYVGQGKGELALGPSLNRR